MSDPEIRDMRPGDFDRVLALNAGEVQWTSPMDRDRLEKLVSLSAYRKVLAAESDLAGFLLAMDNDCGYVNENFDWFRVRYENFLYVDRIVIAQEHAGVGLGRAFYADLFAYAGAKSYERVVCEYSIAPLNEASMAFHAKTGFVEVGKKRLNNVEKEVSMQAKIIEQA